MAPAFAAGETFSITDATVVEGDAGTVDAVFTVTLSEPSDGITTVDYATADGTATVADGDYGAADGTVTFLPGVTSQTITVTVNGDAIDEDDESFSITLSNPTGGASLFDAEGVGTITDDDPTPTVTIGDATLAEGHSGEAPMAFTVSLSNPSDREITVDYATVDGTATAGSDYVATSGTLTFSPGDEEKTVSVMVTGDDRDEAHETFTVALSLPDGEDDTEIADGSGTGTITDDDPTPTLSVDDVTVTEGNDGTVAAIFTVSLSAASNRTVSVTYTTVDDTASSPADYAGVSGTLTFALGDVAETVTVMVNGDTLPEAHETFTLDLSNPENATLDDAQGVGTITDDDTPPTVSVLDADPVLEGATGSTTTATFTVELSSISGRDVEVTYSTADDTAQSGLLLDYQSISGGTVTIPSGELTAPISVTVNGDDVDEVDETFSLVIDEVSGASVADGSAVGVIDDDDGPTLSVDDVSVTEGDGGTTLATFTVSLPTLTTSPQDITFDYATADGTAVAPADYGSASGSATIAAGDNSVDVTVAVVADALHEADETFTFTVSEPTDASCGDCTATGTITDDDSEPSIAIHDVTVDEAAGTAAFAVKLDAASGREVTVDFATADGTATAGTDYQASTGTVTFPIGTTERTISVPVIADETAEQNEMFVVDLTNASNATISDGRGEATIVDDDGGFPTVSVDDVTISEGDSGTTSATFTVSLSDSSTETIQVDAATSDDTGVAGDDYQSTSGQLTFSSGETSKTFSVLVEGDTTYEDHEAFNVTLSLPDGETDVAIGDGTGVGTITDDDDPTVSVSGDTASEAASNLSFDVSLSTPALRPVSVDVATSDDTATAGEDYDAAAVTFTYATGDQTKTLVVPVADDNIDEPDETLDVTLSNASGATIGTGTATGTITDDDATPTVGFEPLSYRHGEGSGSVEAIVVLSGPSARTVTVDYTTADGTATAPADYTPTLVAQELTFAPGVTEQTITIPIADDGTDESDEDFTIALSAPTNATIGDSPATVTIVDDDGPSISVDDVTVTEGDDGTVDATFTVSLSAASEQDVTVDYSTSDGTAVSSSDYTATSGTLTFDSATDETSKQVVVTVTGDVFDEPDETFHLDLSGATNATIDDNRGEATITDDDNPPALSIDDVTVNEGDTGTTDAVFTVTLTQASGKTVTVDFATANGTANDTSDYDATSGSLTFSPGDTTNTITVAVHGDADDESDETFTVSLTNATAATISDATGAGTITNDDATSGGGGGGGGGTGGGGGGGATTGTTTSSDPEGTEPTSDNPMIASVTATSDEPVTITKTDGTDQGTSFHALGFGVDLTGPDATADEPLVLHFDLYAGALPVGTPHDDVDVFRNNTLVGDCPGSSIADPDPCVSSRTIDGTTITITVLTSQLSSWDFALERGVTRLAGTDRVRTAIAASADSFPTAGSADAVVLSRSDLFADALAGVPLAVAEGGPLLLTHPTVLHAPVDEEIARVLPAGGTVHLLGGDNALSAEIEDRLGDLGYTTVRHAGASRYATAVEIAHALGDPTIQLLATGLDFPDALAGGPAAAQAGGSILLTAGDQIPPATKDYLDSLPGSTRYALGGPAARAADTAGIAATEVSGADRFQTAVAAAETFFTDVEQVALAYGLDFPDALAGGAHAGQRNAPLLLTATNVFPTATDDYVNGLGAAPAYAWVYGGDGVISNTVVSAFADALAL